MSKILAFKHLIAFGVFVGCWTAGLVGLILVDTQAQVNLGLVTPQYVHKGLYLTQRGESASLRANYANQKLDYQKTELVVESDQQIFASSLPADWSMYQGVGDSNLYIIETANIPQGKHSFQLELVDESGYTHTVETKFTAPAGRPRVPGWPGSKYFADGDDILAIANKKYRLPMHYQPQGLVDIGKYKIRNFNNPLVRKVMIDDLKEMTKAIEKKGIDYKITSGYRSYATQVVVYNYWLDLQDGDVAKTDAFSARPGHSEHQLGTTIDFVSAESDDTFYQFEKTRLAKWLANNAHKYGFVISYPKGKQAITGYTYEPWHYRYIGKEYAQQLRESGLTLTEWLELQHVPALVSN